MESISHFTQIIHFGLSLLHNLCSIGDRYEKHLFLMLPAAAHSASSLVIFGKCIQAASTATIQLVHSMQGVD